MLTKEQLGERIYLFRGAFDLSQHRLGVAIGKHKSTISLWERGIKMPLKSNLKKICEVFNIPMGWFVKTQAELNHVAGATDLFNPAIKKGEIVFKDGVMMLAKDASTAKNAPGGTPQDTANWPHTTFGQRVKFVRECAGLSKVEFAKKLDVGRRTVYMWENDISLPLTRTLKKMAKIFGTSIDWLKFGIDTEEDIFQNKHTNIQRLSTSNVSESNHNISEINHNISEIKRDKLPAGYNSGAKFMDLYLRLSPLGQGRVLGYLDSVLGQELYND